MANYRSLVPGGFYSSKPGDMSVKRTIRANNPWALNISDWQKTYPGYAGVTGADNSPNANKTTIYETPEQGIAAGWDLLRRYALGGHNTVEKILTRYGGSNQDYSAYLADVVRRSGLSKSTVINLNDDVQMLKLAKAMFRYEAGQEPPWSDAQILYGFKLGRAYNKGVAPPSATAPAVVPTSTTISKPVGEGFWSLLLSLIARLFGSGKKRLNYERILLLGSVSRKGGDVWVLQERLRELGFTDLVIDGEFGLVTDKAVRSFQTRQNLDPDGEVGELTIEALNRAANISSKPPLLPPPATSHGNLLNKPAWYAEAEKDIGWREEGNNQGISYFIKDTKPKNGHEGDPYCAIGINAWLGRSNVIGSGSAMARSFERNANFIKLAQPALGAIVTMWRGSPSSGSGHVFLYDGESLKGVRGIGANEDNAVKRSFHDRSRITGYWWPKSIPMPAIGPIAVADAGTVVTREI